jgi:hypothetical protein
VHLDVPDDAARVRLCRHLFHRHITRLAGSTAVAETSPDSPLPAAATLKAELAAAASPPGALLLLAPDVTADTLTAVAARAAGCSGRQLDKLFLALQARAFASAALTAGPAGAKLPIVDAAMVQDAARAFIASLRRPSDAHSAGVPASAGVPPAGRAAPPAASACAAGVGASVESPHGVDGTLDVADGAMEGGGGLSRAPTGTARKPPRR